MENSFDHQENQAKESSITRLNKTVLHITF